MNPFYRTEQYIKNHLMCGFLSGRGYMRWWHSFSGVSAETGEQRTFFVEYFIRRASHVTVRAGAFPTAESGDLQYQEQYPLSALKMAGDPLVLQIEDCFYSDHHIAGHAKSMEWNLDVHKTTACRQEFWSSLAASALRLLEGYWRGEGLRTLYQGQVSLKGEIFNVTPETCYGYADRHWGLRAGSPILQLNAGSLVSSRTGRELKHSALAVHDCRPRFLWFSMKRRMILRLTYMGESFEFGLLRPGLFSRCRLQKKETNKRYIWHMLAKNNSAVVKLSYSSKKDAMMNLNRKSPLLCGANGTGVIELYRLTDEGRQLLDTLRFNTGFWACREDPGLAIPR